MSTAAPDRSAVLCTRARVAIRRVVPPAPQPKPASRLKSVTRDVSILRSDSRCRRYVSDLSNVTLRCLCSEQKGSFCSFWNRLVPGPNRYSFVVVFDFHLTFSFLVFKMEGCRHRFCSADRVATGFSAKITRFTKKFTRSVKKSLDLKFLRRNSQFCLK